MARARFTCTLARAHRGHRHRRAARPDRRPGHRTGHQDLLYQDRDAADAACRLAARHYLPWSELDGLRAHAALDQAEDTDYGHADQADDLYDRLVPWNLHGDPLATVDRRVARQIAAALAEMEDY